MTRKSTPDILTATAASAPAPTYDLAAAIIAPAPELVEGLRYDYAALGAAGPAIRTHVLAFKAAEKRMAEQTVEAGLELIAIRETIPHNHWLPLLSDELGIGERAAQVMMQTARRFGPKAQTYAVLTPSVLALLAPPSVPDAAVDAAIAAAAVSPVTVTAAKAIIAQHRPARCRKCGRTLTDPAAIAAGIGAYCAAHMAHGAAQAEATAEAVEDRPLPEWAQEPATVAVAPEFPTVGEPQINVTMHPDAPAPATIAQRVIDVMDAYGITPRLALAPAPAPPQPDSGAAVHVDADPHTAALVALAARLEQWVAEWRDVAQVYGEKTGDHLTPLAVKHGIERMQATVQSNMPNGGWD